MRKVSLFSFIPTIPSILIPLSDFYYISVYMQNLYVYQLQQPIRPEIDAGYQVLTKDRHFSQKLNLLQK